MCATPSSRPSIMPTCFPPTPNWPALLWRWSTCPGARCACAACCPPSLDLLTINGLCAADTVLIPLQCEYYALEGLTELMNTLKMVRKKYNRYLDIEGVLFTMYSGRLNLTMQVVAQVKKYYGDKVFKAVIPRSVRLSEAPSFGMPINFYEPNGKGCEAYMELAREFLSKNER